MIDINDLKTELKTRGVVVYEDMTAPVALETYNEEEIVVEARSRLVDLNASIADVTTMIMEHGMNFKFYQFRDLNNSKYIIRYAAW